VAVAVLSEWFRIPSIRIAEAYAAAGQAHVYMYLFTYANPAGGPLGATHALEVPLVLHNLATSPVRRLVLDAQATPDQVAAAYRLSDVMSDAWVAFAHTGDPRHAGLPPWPPYAPADRATMIFDITCHLAHDPLGAERAAWQGLPAWF
jgi:para-nitrobenzyl esterase